MRSSYMNQPFVAAAPTQADMLSRLLSEDFDDSRCARLLGGLVWARPAALAPVSSDIEQPSPPFAYAALKLLFAPDHLVDRLARRS